MEPAKNAGLEDDLPDSAVPWGNKTLAPWVNPPIFADEIPIFILFFLGVVALRAGSLELDLEQTPRGFPVVLRAKSENPERSREQGGGGN